jgi:SAM-dependent methyltransferase
VTSEHVLVNRENWDNDASNWVERGRRSWAGEPEWGIWGVPDADLGVLPDDLEGRDTIELGCGTAYVSAWLARRGARPVGLDNSSAQLRTAQMLQGEFDLRFPLIHGDAEHTPLRDASFDLAISEYGAAIWCDPYVWIPEAARILRPGGRLIFLGHSPILQLTWPDDDPDAPATDRLHRPYFGLHRFEWDEEEGLAIEFCLPHGEMIRHLHANGFELEDLIEVQAPADAETPSDALTSAEWSQRWPCEDVWKARKTG